MARFTRALPFSVSSARSTRSGEASERIPISVARAVGTRRVILSFSNEITNISSLRPATSCSSMDTMRPTPWAG